VLDREALMTLRAIPLALVAALVVPALPHPARAQPSGKPHRIAVLESAGPAGNAADLGALREGLRELGYEEGRHFVIEHRAADGRPERLRALARELARLEVDVIVAPGTPAAFAARRATDTIPIVAVASGDPAGAGALTSLIRPGSNLTGVHGTAPPELGGARLRLLKEIVPGVSRVAVLWNPQDLYPHLVKREIEKVASAMGVRLESFPVRGAWELERAFEAAALGRVDALITVEDYVTVTHRTRIVDFAAVSRLPAVHGSSDFVDAGGLLAYGTERRDLLRRSAAYVHRILEGARPADLPLGQPTKFELVVNLRAARALGLTIPQSLLRRADRVIE
jgi:putative ABC transport system substrate-binding protein